MGYHSSILLAIISVLLLTSQVTQASSDEQSNMQTQQQQHIGQRLKELDEKLSLTDQKLMALESLKIYSQKNKGANLTSANIDEVATINKQSLNKVKEEQAKHFQSMSSSKPKPGIAKLNSQVSQKDEHKIFEKSLIKSSQPTSIIELAQVKPFRSIHYQMVNTVVLTVVNNSVVVVADISGNTLEEIKLDTDSNIISVGTPSSQEDMVVALLTESKELFSLKFQLQDIYANDPNIKDEKSKKKQQATQLPLYQSLNITVDKKINIADIITQANFTLAKDTSFNQVILSRQKGRFLISVLDNNNFITSFSKELNIHSRYQIEMGGNEQIIGLKKWILGLMLYSKSKVGFVKILDKSLVSSLCPIGNSVILDLATNNLNPSQFYVSTGRGEIQFFEVLSKGDLIDCRVKGRIEASDSGLLYSRIESSNYFLYGYLTDGNLQVIKINDLEKLISGQSTTYLYKVQQKLDQEKQNKLQLSVFQNQILIQLHGNEGILIVENLENIKQDGSKDGWDLSSMRYFMFFLAIVGVGGYQYYRFTTKKQEEKIAAQNLKMSTQKSSAAGGSEKDQYDQMRKMLEEMEALKQQTESMTQSLGGITKAVGQKKQVNQALNNEQSSGEDDDE